MVALGPLVGRTPNIGLPLINFNTPTWHTYAWESNRIIDGILNSVIGVTNLSGLWAVSTAYVVGNRIINPANGLIYECAVAHTSGTDTMNSDITAHPSYWIVRSPSLPVYRGVWQATTNYSQGDFVYYNNKFGVVTNTYTSSEDFDDDVTNNDIEVLIDISSSLASMAALLAEAQQAATDAVAAGSSARVTVSNTPPTVTFNGMVWYDPNSGRVSVRYEDGDSSQWIALNTPAVQASTRNIIINGLMDFNRRGGSAYSSIGVYTLDRWRLSWLNDGTIDVTVSQVALAKADIDAFRLRAKNAMQIAVGSGNVGTATISQRIEHPEKYAGETVVVSFKARILSGSPVDVGVRMYQVYDAATADPADPASEVVQLTTEWRYFFMAFELPLIGSRVPSIDGFLTLRFDLVGTNYTVQITAVQVERGSIPTPYEYRSIGQELEMCERYYQSGSFRDRRYVGSTNFDVRCRSPYRAMRKDPPNVSTTEITNTNTTGATVTALAGALRYEWTAPAAGATDYGVNYVLEAEL